MSWTIPQSPHNPDPKQMYLLWSARLASYEKRLEADPNDRAAATGVTTCRAALQGWAESIQRNSK